MESAIVYIWTNLYHMNSPVESRWTKSPGKIVSRLRAEYPDPLEDWKRFFVGSTSIKEALFKNDFPVDRPATVIRYFSVSEEFLVWKSNLHGRSRHRTKESTTSKPPKPPKEMPSLEKAKWAMKFRNLTPLFGDDEWVGCLQKGSTRAKYYKVRCNLCGTEYETWFSAGNCSKCPGCSKGAINSNKTKFLRIQKYCRDANVTPLFDSLDKPLSKGRGNYFPVRCNVCGTEFETMFYGRVSNHCPVCHKYSNSSSRVNKAIRIRKTFQSKGLSLTSGQDIVNQNTPSGHRNFYKVVCDTCGFVFSTYAGGGCPRCQSRSFRSHREEVVCKFLKDRGVVFVSNTKEVVSSTTGNRQEIDLLIPSLGVAFEFNGMYYHNSSPTGAKKDRTYHSNKTISCLSQGIKLHHIWEDCPDDLMFSIIESKLGLSKKLFARKLIIWDNADKRECSEFFEQNHIDGDNRHADRYFALRDEMGVIYCCLSLLRRRIQVSGDTHWEIGRFANKKHFTVVGGYSRLLKCAVKFLKTLGVTELISYCNRDISPDPESTFYSKFGFEYLGDSGPIYWYWSDKVVEINGKYYKGRISRQVVQKQKLLEHFLRNHLEVDPSDTERTLCSKLGLVPVYNSGNFKYRLLL